MLTTKILLFTVFVSFSICDICESNIIRVKPGTTSFMFRKMKTKQASKCNYIKKDFDKLKGHWYFVQRIVTRDTPKIRCGHLNVNETSDLGFKSTLTYITNDNKVARIPITGNYINETVIQIPQLNTIVSGNPEWKYPPYIEMGLCNNDSILFTEAIYYLGGGMVLTRKTPGSDVALHLRFGTFDAELGREFIESVDSNCTISKYRIRNS